MGVEETLAHSFSPQPLSRIHLGFVLDEASAVLILESNTICAKVRLGPG